jgi:arylformamidase
MSCHFIFGRNARRDGGIALSDVGRDRRAAFLPVTMTLRGFTMGLSKRLLIVLCVAVPTLLSSNCVFAARTLYRQYAQTRERTQLDDDEGGAVSAADLPAGIHIANDVSYGSDARQKFDVYAPKDAKNAPIIVMVHGGGWAFGDKRMSRVVTNKVKYWVPKGYVFISIGYRLLPTASVEEQARDVANAVAAVEQRAATWGGNGSKIVLMGHSAGAHLVALLAASPSLVLAAGAKPWTGSVLLDSAAFDLAAIMRGRHLPLYNRAFGSDPARWDKLSPLVQLSARPSPLLAICSTRRIESCPHAEAFVDKARSLGAQALVQRENKTHGEINADLGAPGAYTDAVDGFIRAIGVIPAR